VWWRAGGGVGFRRGERWRTCLTTRGAVLLAMIRGGRTREIVLTPRCTTAAMFNLAPRATCRGDPAPSKVIARVAATAARPAAARGHRQRRGLDVRHQDAEAGGSARGSVSDASTTSWIVGACPPQKSSALRVSSTGSDSAGGGVAGPNGTRFSRGPSQSRGRRTTLSEGRASVPASIWRRSSTPLLTFSSYFLLSRPARALVYAWIRPNWTQFATK
jgi:hypothetical protein